MAALDPVQHYAEGVELFITQYKDKPRLAALLKSWLDEVQKLEDVLLEVIDARNLDTATAAQLDTLGRIVGEFRNDQTDEIFRVHIRARIRSNLSLGTPNDILEVLQTIGLAVDDPSLFENQASFLVYLDSDESSFGETIEPASIVAIIRRIKPTGVRFGVVIPPPGSTSLNTFSFSHIGESDGDRGFGHVGSTDYGGVLSSVYE